MERNYVNVMEEIVATLVTILLTGPEYQTFCHCDKCRTEVIVLSLNNLPNHYVSDEESRKNAYDQLNTPENLKWINKRIISAIYTVGKYPKHGN
ncbi:MULTISPECIES: late competence development ComFB family protein [Bacillus]|uniref:late competence development ComFB family protein n=1 Tax=Bacillus TaxID=1386 RepID=UPI0002DA9469|nr:MULTISPECIES: late competence development ComFB family protein [Bacillus]